MTRLLIVKLSSIGDILHALPVVKSIKIDRADLSIGWVVRARCSALLAGCEFLDDIHVIENRPSLADLIRLRSELLVKHYDTAFDMQGLFLSGLITLLSGAKRRVGFDRNRELNKLFLTDASVAGREKRHAVDILLGFREKLGLGPVSRLPAVTHLGGSEFDFATLGLTFQDKKRVALNVGASTIYKRWPREQWVALGQALVSEGHALIITAGPSEVDDADNIATECGDERNVLNLAGKTSQNQLATVFRHADLVVSGDTGPLHLAVAVGTPTLALFGPTDPKLTGPYGPDNVVIWKKLECSPCFRHPTCHGRVDCLQAISYEEVLTAANKILFPNVLAAGAME